nr:HlyD family secretion protein [Rhizobium leguminosarum]
MEAGDILVELDPTETRAEVNTLSTSLAATAGGGHEARCGIG